MRARFSNVFSWASMPFAFLFGASPTLAGDWGRNWAEVTWGEVIAAVPLTGKVGFALLTSGLVMAASWVIRFRRPAVFMFSHLFLPLFVLDLVASRPVQAQTSASEKIARADLADPDAMNRGIEVAQEQILNTGTERATNCAALGGSWDIGTSTCMPVAGSYDCFVGGFCSQAAIWFPPPVWGYANIYEGHTRDSGQALAAGCNASPGEYYWGVGDLLSSVYLPIFYPYEYLNGRCSRHALD